MKTIVLFLLCVGLSGQSFPPSSSGGSTVGSVVAVDVTAATSVTLTHNIGSKDHFVGCYDSSDIDVIAKFTRGVNADTIAFDPAFTGRCLAGIGGGGGSGDTTSVANSGATGASVLKTGTNVTARKIKAGTNVTVTEGTDDITIAASGSGTVTSGTGLTGDGSSGDPLRMDPSGGGASQVLYSAALAGWGTIAASSCVEKNITATGAVAGESVIPGWPSTLPANLTGIVYAATNLVVVRLCNVTATGVAVGDGLTFGGRIVRGF